MTKYDPKANYEIKVWDEEFRRTPKRTLMARVYQPQGKGPFPVILDLHGGAWNEKDRLANVPMCEAVAKSGVLVVAIDLRLGPEAPYPASVQDANYGVRWLKSRARQWNGDASSFGVLGSSSGGHVAQLLALRPNDPRYNAIPVEGAKADAKIDYVITRSPISDPLARFAQAEKMGRKEMMQKSKVYFDPWETIEDGNPQKIVERREAAELPPLLIMQGGADDNVIPEIQERFAETYCAAGGECQLEVFPGCSHQWVADPGPDTDRAHEVVKAFIARQLSRAKVPA